ncbi:hypothetical protein FOH24_12345 [Acetobacter tropicalis]|nr:hypothetical protein CPF11_11460 [Acetobacter pomorum]KAA8388634.1 hypothetical protein FOH24_12345 [Acetobacter tropicalis]KAA8391192.1 hypothetical protein FOH22_00790 [Acetobacter tropicalis]
MGKRPYRRAGFCPPRHSLRSHVMSTLPNLSAIPQLTTSMSEAPHTHSSNITRLPRTPRAPKALNENRPNIFVPHVVSDSKPMLDPETAAKFLNFMSGGAGICNLRTLTDCPSKKANPTGRNSSLQLPILPQDLLQLEAQNKQGRGIFWVVNEGGQKAADISAPRALYVDYDGDDLAGFLKRLDTMPPPHAVVESSHGKRHVYWKCHGVPVAEFEALQQGLIAQLGTDKSIHDLPRVMRVPGFLHQKDKAQLVRLLHLNENLPAYTLEQCRAFAKPLLAEKGRRTLRQPKLTAQATAPAGRNADVLAYFNNAALNLPPWPEIEAEQQAYDRKCITSAVAFLAEAGHAENHDDWQTVGADLKGCTRGVEGAEPALTDKEAFDLFVQFSGAAPNGAAGDLEYRWENIGTDIFGCGALLNRAKQAGWEPPPHPKSQRAKLTRALADTSNTVEAEAHKVSDDDLITNGKGHPVTCLANAVFVLGRAEKTKNAFRYNELTGNIEYRPYNTWRPLADADIPVLQLWIQRSAMPRIARADVEQAILVRGYAHKYHPIREWMDGLQWDGVPRVNTWLHTYLGAADNEYTRLVGRLFLIGMIARIQQPGCKMDNMLILEGPQGAGKSSALAILAGKDYFSDGLADISSKDASLAMRGRWLIEIAELAASSKAEAEHLKAFVSRNTERYRPPFGRLEVSEPRQCVLAGTTNVGTYLKDASGARRFWPVMVGHIDLEGLERDRNQLFAEALHLYQSGAIWWPTTAQQQALFMLEQDARFEADPWESYVEQYLQEESKTAAAEGKECRVTVANVATCRGINLEVSRTTTRENRRIVAILQRLGWIQKRTKGARYYVKNNATT